MENKIPLNWRSEVFGQIPFVHSLDNPPPPNLNITVAFMIKETKTPFP